MAALLLFATLLVIKSTSSQQGSPRMKIFRLALIRTSGTFGLVAMLLFSTASAQTGQKAKSRTVPGRTPSGTLLPNGWTLTPEGEQITVSQLPLNIVLSSD